MRIRSVPHLALFLAAFSTAANASLIVTGDFGSNGDLGFANSPPSLQIQFGQAGQGALYQMDGFLNVPGVDFGGGAGVSAELTDGPPASLGFFFFATQPTQNQLLLTYIFANQTANPLAGLQFLWFVDPDIGENFADEAASVTGTFAPSATYEVGDPSTSPIFFTGLLSGVLNNADDQPSSNPGDVSMALGFQYGSLGIGQSALFQILMADDGSHLGNSFITQTDPIYTGDRLTISGQTLTPEPGTISLMMGAGLVGLAIRRRVRPLRAGALSRRSVANCKLVDHLGHFVTAMR